MKTVKISLANIQGKLSRTEMKSIMAGSGGGGVSRSGTNWYGGQCYCDYTMTFGGTTRYSCNNPCDRSYCGH